MDKAHEVLQIPDDIEQKLADLEEDLKTLKTVLKALAIIPQIKTPIKAIEKTVTAAQDTLKKVKKVVEDFDNNHIEPCRDFLEEFSARLGRNINSTLLMYIRLCH